MGEGIRFPDALRQLYAFCNGLSVHDADLWTFGFNVLPLTTSSTGLDFFGDQELRADWYSLQKTPMTMTTMLMALSMW
jgi:hypothetical protein